ncbi:hypothetical protein RHSIM_Rhsim07G0127700 [Rhododendron simsii]|uniref:R13L1/DRL21-like LRR repeat region domain-containing protein n=1 Tax=Rhododendron simsii TaxID=118357 RepID=A0A834GR99_RHOSS|nr:hypothetical protein RHSIM_Rhsim07G0127700 [Rhododendron simsii]
MKCKDCSGGDFGYRLEDGKPYCNAEKRIGINELEEFHCLRGTISISGLQNVKSSHDALEARIRLQNVKSSHDALEAKISEKRHLERLALKWYSTTEDSQNARDLEVINCPKLIGHLPTKVLSLVVGIEIVDCPKIVASLLMSTSTRKLVLNECQGVQLEGQSVPSVEKLEISGFERLKEFASELVILTNLKELMVEKCPRLYEELSEEMSHCYTSLERLDVSYCERLKSLPLGLFPKLRSVQIWHCTNFETLLIPDGIELQNLTLLESLSIGDCINMFSLPCGGLPAPNLSFLLVDCCEKLEALPEQMHALLPSLQSLVLHNCPKIESFPEGGLPSKLGALDIRNCKKLVGGRRDWGLQTLPSLISFSMFDKSRDVLESFPEEGLLPPTLTFFSFGRLLNLKSLNKRGLQRLGSLDSMLIFDCPQLQSLPKEELPNSLFELQICDCPLLKPRCRREEGEDWHKIAHISFIKIDGEVISE